MNKITLLLVVLCWMPSLVTAQLYDATFDKKDTVKVCQSIEQALRNPDSVEVLILQGQQLEDLPESIAQLRNLKELYLGYIQLIGNIKRNRFKEIPKVVFQLENLELLQLNHNPITEIPEDIKHLKKLKRLELLSTAIEVFPKTVYSLPNLRYLALSSSPITEIPNDIHQLRKLKTLKLRFLDITTLPHEIGALKNLRWLDLYGTSLTSLPRDLKYCERLYKLNIESTDSLDKDAAFNVLKDLPKLKQLHLNKVTRLPTSIAEFKALEYLRMSTTVSRTDFSALFSQLAQTPNLKRLSIRFYSRGTWEVPEELGLCTKLEWLGLFGGSRQTKVILPSDIQGLTALRTLKRKCNVLNLSEVKSLLPEGCEIR